MRLAVVIATSFDRTAQVQRARRAYLRETPVTPQIVVVDSHNVRRAGFSSLWEEGLEEVNEDVELIHFTSDWLDPHPGWYQAARAAALSHPFRIVAAPMLWEEDGTPPAAAAEDWAPAAESRYPTLTRAQIKRFGVPPLAPDCGARFVYRVNYAFTVRRV